MKASGAVMLGMLALLVTGCRSANKAGGASGGKTIVLTFASQFSGGEPDQLVRFANEVTRRSEGTIRIDFKGSWRARDPRQELDTIRDVRAGKVDLGWVGARAWDWVGVHSFDPLVAPFLIDSYPLEQRVFARRIPQRMLVGVRRAGVVGIGVLPGPMRKVLGVRGRLASPSDFHDIAFGVQGIVAAETLDALGARPRQLFAQAPLTGLGGVESQMSAIVGNGYDTTARYLSANLNLWPRPLVIFASPKIFDSLNKSQRRVLREAAVSAVPQAMDASKLEDVGAAHALCSRGKLTLVDLTQGQLQSLARAVAPVYRQLRKNTATRRAIAQVEALRRTMPGPPAIRCKSAASTSAAVAATPIDGTWEMKVTASELVGNPAYGHSVTLQDVEPDVGTYRFVFEHGRLESSLVQTSGTTRDRGTYRLHGDLATFHITGGHDIGETWSYRWSVYRDALTFRRPPPSAPQGPPNPMLAPWHRVGR